MTEDFIQQDITTDSNNLTLAKAFGMKFNPDGSLSSASNVGNTPVFKKLNRKQRRAKGVYGHKFKKVLKRV